MSIQIIKLFITVFLNDGALVLVAKIGGIVPAHRQSSVSFSHQPGFACAFKSQSTTLAYVTQLLKLVNNILMELLALKLLLSMYIINEFEGDP